jgi:hypothetical protein
MEISTASVKEQLNALVKACPKPDGDDIGDQLMEIFVNDEILDGDYLTQERLTKAYYALGWLNLACKVLDLSFDELIDEYL